MNKRRRIYWVAEKVLCRLCKQFPLCSIRNILAITKRRRHGSFWVFGHQNGFYCHYRNCACSLNEGLTWCPPLSEWGSEPQIAILLPIACRLSYRNIRFLVTRAQRSTDNSCECHYADEIHQSFYTNEVNANWRSMWRMLVSIYIGIDILASGRASRRRCRNFPA